MNDVVPQPPRPDRPGPTAPPSAGAAPPNPQGADAGPNAGQSARVQGYFKEAAASWGGRYRHKPRGMADLDLLLRRENVHRLLRPLLAGAPRRLRVLDVGCGTGDVLDGLPRDCMSLTGVDMVAEMIEEARRTHPGDTFLVADATNLPFEPESMDVITSLGVLEYVPDPQAVLRSMWRVLAPGGHLIMSFPNRRSPFRRLRPWERAMERGVLALLAWTGLRRPPAGSSASYGHAHWTVREVERLLAACAFDVLDAAFQNYGLWGRVGRWRASLALSRWLSRRLRRRGILSTWLASTMVVLARKPVRVERPPDPASAGGGGGTAGGSG